MSRWEFPVPSCRSNRWWQNQRCSPTWFHTQVYGKSFWDVIRGWSMILETTTRSCFGSLAHQHVKSAELVDRILHEFLEELLVGDVTSQLKYNRDSDAMKVVILRFHLLERWRKCLSTRSGRKYRVIQEIANLKNIVSFCSGSHAFRLGHLE